MFLCGGGKWRLGVSSRLAFISLHVLCRSWEDLLLLLGIWISGGQQMASPELFEENCLIANVGWILAKY